MNGTFDKSNTPTESSSNQSTSDVDLIPHSITEHKEKCCCAEQQLIEQFLSFAEAQGIVLGGDVIYGFALEYTEFRPLKKDDYTSLITDFLKYILKEK
ncbi:MAG: hypothetical protein WC450_07365 [Candidatus Omnitrophota bacterium]|jgi:hypothetical protein